MKVCNVFSTILLLPLLGSASLFSILFGEESEAEKIVIPEIPPPTRLSAGEYKQRNVTLFTGVHPDGRVVLQSARTFECSSGRVDDPAQSVIPISSVNDDYCDCLDGSDEPGTSACHNSHFTCINNEQYVVTIPSSRVDDGICDCCNGEDEGRSVLCPNTCHIEALKKAKAKAHINANFKAGAKQREADIQSATKKFSGSDAKIAALKTSIEGLRNQVTSLEELKDLRVTQKWHQYKGARATAGEAAADLLRLNTLQPSEVKDFALSLLGCLSHEEEGKRELINSFLEAHEGMGKQSGDDKPKASIGTLREGMVSEPEDDYEEGSEDGVDTDRVEALGYEEQPIGSELTEEQDIHFIHFLLAEKQCYAEAQLILGFYHMHHRFGSDATGFAMTNTMSSNDAQTCASAVFREMDNPADVERFCTMHTKLEKAFKSATLLAPQGDSGENSAEDAESSKISALMTTISTKNTELSELETVSQRLDKYQSTGGMGFLARKGSCLDVNDGKYTYSFCYDSKVTQTGTDGGSATTLGHFDSISVDEDTGGLLMRFDRGDHCWNHGPRMADIKIICGRKDVLVAATEPSTCHYVLEMESPQACSPQWKQKQGIIFEEDL